jgi:uncharacterized protein (TIGR03382 family)
MRFSVALCVLAVPAIAFAEDGGKPTQPQATVDTNKAVIGGAVAPAGKWPDCAAIMFSGQQECTGTLIAPNVVITAGHCVIGGPAPDHVLVGAPNLTRPQDGETLAVMKAIEYPSSQTSIDVGILLLSQSSTKVTPRTIGSGWERFDIKNASSVQIVGWGATDKQAMMYPDDQMEATTTITDFNCTTSSGCNTPAKPDGEMGVGGMGIDTCPGDSGGPVYLTSGDTTYVIGVTSRSYDNATYACSEGGIYERPDKIVDWIDMVTGVKVARGPEPTADPIMVVQGDAGETQIKHNDPKPGTEHSYEITKPPGYATAKVRDDGLVRVCAMKGVIGGDAMEVTVSDKADPDRKLVVKIPVVIADGDAPDSCDVDDFGGGEGGGCCDTRRSAGGSLPLGLVVLLVLRRRRK